MHGLSTPFSTTWFLAPYCAWLGYGERTSSFGTDITSHLPQCRICMVEQVGYSRAILADVQG